jgi:hypothetical protein
MLHRELQYEHGLLSSRMAWYGASQSLLMIALAAAGAQNHTMPWLAKLLLPTLGLSVSLVVLFAAHAATRALGVLREELLRLFDAHPHLERAPFGIRSPDLDRHGLFAPRWIPLVFVLAWSAALALANL